MFFDEAEIHVKSGNGGHGAMSFRREKYVPFGGPDGGDGGRGGSVYLIARQNENTLLKFRHQRHFKAERGGGGAGSQKHGAAGHNLEISVPIGTVVSDADGNRLADLALPNERVMVARGGRGGLGNAHFATSTNQAPRFAQKGEPGEELDLKLELRLIADIGIIGYPNVGKSTFLAATTRARPKIANYAFTTLTPNLGVALVDDDSFVLADIPGLIEGAHEGAGLGHEFLRHIRRTKVLIHIIDGMTEDVLADFDRVNEELRLFDAELAQKPQLVAVNKLDLSEVRERCEEVQRSLAERGVESHAISAVTGEGVPALLRRAVALLHVEVTTQARSVAETPAVLRPEPRRRTFSVGREAGHWQVRGPQVERLVAMTDLNSDEGLAWLQRELRRTGLTEALERTGVKSGDTVYIGETELEWR